jgi:hypothetical protein
MDREKTPGEHWDGTQMERDTEGEPPDGTPQGEVWNRHQMETDDTGVDTEDVEPTRVDDDTSAGGLSGHGQPSGESHWARTEDEPSK